MGTVSAFWDQWLKNNGTCEDLVGSLQVKERPTDVDTRRYRQLQAHPFRAFLEEIFSDSDQIGAVA